MEIIIVPIVIVGLASAAWAVWKHYKACEKAGFDGSSQR